MKKGKGKRGGSKKCWTSEEVALLDGVAAAHLEVRTLLDHVMLPGRVVPVRRLRIDSFLRTR